MKNNATPKIIFLDRDGVINRFPGRGLYVTRLEDFHLIPDSVRAIALLHRAGYELYVVSNQGCLSKGEITQAGLNEITQRMLTEVEKAGGRIDGVFYCPHQTSDKCDCKKPKTALFHKGLKGRAVDRQKVFFIGDSPEDMQAGRTLGCRTVLVLSGRVAADEIDQLPVKPDYVKNDLLEAARWILNRRS